MKTLEDIKHDYVIFKDYPTEEEVKYYNIQADSYIKWRTEYSLDKRNKLFTTINKLVDDSDDEKSSPLVGTKWTSTIHDQKYILEFSSASEVLLYEADVNNNYVDNL